MGDVIKFKGQTKLDLSPNQVLAAATDELETAIVVGVTKHGDFYFASSTGDGSEVVWWLERAKHKLMTITDDLEEGA